MSIDDDEARSWQELKTLLAARVEEGLGGEISAKGVDAIVEEEMGRDKRAAFCRPDLR